jgi:hypothetical protein
MPQLSGAPVVSAGADRTVVAGAPIVLRGAATDDGPLVAVRWELGDGTVAGGPLVQHAYARPGIYSAVLTATDGGGLIGRDEALVTVVAPRDGPVVHGGRAATAFVGDRVAFAGRARPGGAPLARAVWRFGDGRRGAGLRSRHVYRRAGSFVAALEVTDAAGRIAVAERLVTVERLRLRLVRAERRGRTVVLRVRTPAGGAITARTAGRRPATARAHARRAGMVRLQLRLSTGRRAVVTVRIVRAQGATAVLRVRA